MISCGNDDAFRRAYEETVEAELSIDELRRELLALDQDYPHRLRLKTDLAILALTGGELEEAGIYIDKALGLLDQAKKDPDLGYLTYAAAADWTFKSADYDTALNHAENALNLSPEDSLGTGLIKARCLFLREEKGGALALYESFWLENQALMTREDFRLYINLLIEGENYEKALEVTHFQTVKYGFTPGTGVLESAILERMGDINGSLLAAYLELEYQRGYGEITRPQILEKLDEIGVKLQSPEWKDGVDGELCLSALASYEKGDYQEADTRLTALDCEANQSMYQYLHLASGFYSHTPTIAEIESFVGLEQIFRGHPLYYHHLWNGMKRGSGQYSFDNVRPILEKAILLGSATPEAMASRVELGRLMGLDGGDSEYLLLEPELEAVYHRYNETGELAALIPVIRTLAIPTNAYTPSAEAMMKALKQRAEVRTFLEELLKGAEGIMEIRLRNILNS